jgi:hypothetical protein
MVNSLTVGFTSVVGVDAGAFTLVNRTTGHHVQLNVALDESTGKTVATLMFIGSEIIGGSLADGNYLLTIDLDGDSVADDPDDYRFGADQADAFFRFYGDTDGDRDVDNMDYFQLRSTYLQIVGTPRYLWYLDYDLDGIVDADDIAQFQARYRRVLP